MNVRLLLALYLASLGACGEGLRLEEGEDYPGGDTTNFLLLGAQAFTFPASNLTEEERALFFSGNAFFNQAWVVAPASTSSRDGIGPIFHARSCSTCHARDGRSGPPEGDEPITRGVVLLSIGNAPDGAPLPDPVYGPQLQPFGVPGVPGEASPHLSYEEREGRYDDGEVYSLRVPTLELRDPAYGPFDPDLGASVRMAPAMVGLGLLEAVTVADLEALADPDDLDGDGISGELQRLPDGRIGRFGWKAGQPTVRDQSAAAFAGDMGLTNTDRSEGPCTEAQAECMDAPNGGDPEVSDEILDRVALYSQTLAVPARPRAAEVLEGRELMRTLGCTSCHTPTHVTGATEPASLAHQRIFPYTDLLLHDMGPELADGRAEYEASGSEWRTPPLWGVGLVPRVNGHDALMHDGRARGFAEAILWHGGEAAAAAEAFRALSQEDRALLLAFLESL